MGRAIGAFVFLAPLHAGCDGIGPKDTADAPTTDSATDPPPPTDTEPTPDTDLSPTTPTDSGSTDTGTVTPGDTAIRVVNSGADLGAQDMVVNGNLPPVLDDLAPADGTVYSPRPPASYTFQFKDGAAALSDAWITFDYELLDARRHSFVIYGTSLAPDVLPLLDDDLTLDPSLVRVRWTHVAPSLPSVLDLYDLAGGAPIQLGLGYGDSVEIDLAPAETQVGVDLDGDTVADFVFESFQRTAGEYFHVMVTNETDGTPFLLGHTEDGTTPRRDLVP